MDVRYVIEGSMPSAVNDLTVTTGYNADDIDGRAVVVHDYDGVRIGCAIIEMPEEEPAPVDGDDLYVFDLSPYVGSSSPYQPQGVIEVKSTDDSKTVLSWSLTGLDPGCSSECTQTNCCGIHIHEGPRSLSLGSRPHQVPRTSSDALAIPGHIITLNTVRISIDAVASIITPDACPSTSSRHVSFPGVNSLLHLVGSSRARTHVEVDSCFSEPCRHELRRKCGPALLGR